jgi:hypothetical protein
MDGTCCTSIVIPKSVYIPRMPINCSITKYFCFEIKNYRATVSNFAYFISPSMRNDLAVNLNLKSNIARESAISSSLRFVDTDMKLVVVSRINLSSLKRTRILLKFLTVLIRNILHCPSLVFGYAEHYSYKRIEVAH